MNYLFRQPTLKRIGFVVALVLNILLSDAAFAQFGDCNIKPISSFTPGERCGPGYVTLSVSLAGTNATKARWFKAGNPNVVHIGTTYTVYLEETAIFAVQSYISNSCASMFKVPVSATVHPTGSSPGSISGTQTICYNTVPQPVASIASGSGSYSWYKNDNGSYLLIPGANSSSYSPPALTKTTTFMRKSTFKDKCGTTSISNTNTVTMSVKPPFSGGNISGDQMICPGSSSSTLVNSQSASNGLGTYNYQWQQKSGDTWSNISGANGTSYNPGALSITKQYRRAVTTSCGTAYSNTVTISVNPLDGGSVSASKSICYNTNAGNLVETIAPKGGMGSYSYQWQRKTEDGLWANIAGAVNSTYSPGILSTTANYRRNVIDQGGCGTDLGDIVTITVDQQSNGGSINGSKIEFLTGSGSITLNGQIGTVVHWEKHVLGSGMKSTFYSPGNTLNYSGLTQTTEYRALIQNGTCSAVYSTLARITIVDPPYIKNNASDYIFPGGSLQLSTEGDFYSYQWKKDNADISGATNKLLTVTEPGVYNVLVVPSLGGTAYLTGSYTIYSALENSTAEKNSITKIQFKRKGIDDNTDVNNLESEDYSIITTYFDQLGRLEQEVAMGISPHEGDMIIPFEYDNFGRQEKDYLPYIDRKRQGIFRNSAIADQSMFYQTAAKTAHTNVPFSEKKQKSLH